MTVNANEQQLQNPWQDRSAVPTLPRLHAVAAALAVAVSAAGLAFLSYEPVCWGVMAALFLYVAFFVRVPSTVTLALMTPAACVILLADVRLAALAICLTAGASAGALLLTGLKRNRFLVLLLPLAVFVGALIYSGDPVSSLMALAALPAAILMSVATLKGRGRTTSVCFAAGGLIAVVAGALAYVLISESTAAGMSVGELIADLQRQAVDVGLQIRDEMLRLWEEAGNSDKQMEALRQTLTEEYLTAFVREAFGLLPGIITAILCVLAYEAHSMLNASYRVSGLGCVLTPESQVLTMSVVSAVLYMIATLLYLFVPGTGIVTLTAGNFCVMLMPGFLVVGLRSLMLLLARMRGKRGWLFLLLGALLCCNFTVILFMLALWGANATVTGALQRKLAEKMKNFEDHDHFED